MRQKKLFNKTRGFSLVDVLVSGILITTTAVGMLAMSTRGAEEIRFQKRLMFAKDSVDFLSRRVEATLDANSKSVYEKQGSDVLFDAVECSLGCTSTQTAQWDMFQWTRDLSANLPEAQYRISINEADTYSVIVSLKWAEKGSDVQSDPDCELTIDENEICITEQIGVIRS